MKVAEQLKARLRVTDFAARLGGDEFAVIRPHADRAAAERVANELTRAIAQLQPTGFRASCGIALYDSTAVDLEAVLAYPDRAMYRAKGAGRTRAR